MTLSHSNRMAARDETHKNLCYKLGELLRGSAPGRHLRVYDYRK